VVGVECLYHQQYKERVWLMFLGSMAGLEVGRLAFGMGMPLGYTLQRAVLRLPAGMLARSSLPSHLEAYIGRMEPGIEMEEVPPLRLKDIEVMEPEVILFRSNEMAVIVVVAALLGRSMMALAPSTDAP
jgi:hypothetical protein